MSGVQVLVYGEGPHELGRTFDTDLPSNHLPSLPGLVHRLLDRPEGASYTCRRFKDVRAAHQKGKKFGKKVISAVRQAKKDGFGAVVVLIDRDREPDKERIGALREGRDAAQKRSGLPPCAIGTAVETFDAWMIVDREAIRAAGGDPERSHSNPEDLDGGAGSPGHPKNCAQQVFDMPKGTGLGEKYAIVAAHVNLHLLAERCPQGFKPFAEDVQKRIIPIVKCAEGPASQGDV